MEGDVSSAALHLTEFKSREEASEAAADLAEDTLGADIARTGAASLMVSGGSSPAGMFDLLSAKPLDWARITVGLVDERWVAPDHPDSNERLVRARLLKDAAERATFLPMKTAHASPAEAVADRHAAYAPHCVSISFLLLGMGTDGHTASWFPGTANLAGIVSPDAVHCVAAVDAPRATVPQRMTLTGAAVFHANRALLLVFGAEKRSMLLNMADTDPMNCPVRFAVDGLGDRLSIFWAP
ncbi:MAG: 6-phosphogluconolactonase [Hyphomonas sp.]|nr:6-phosphogluconolactonase [Hyphomonas sp.]